ncbi:hypothetical protein A2V95_01585 [Candidatus Kuenenbacteria bacterium RBG_16_41_7]|uniref:Integral membrane protein n=1 Tax=Candidatus Kuenenbacteria bacterium RBG_16_41_7 TaxID=1798560 RepID=A0A1F6GCX0_9BACT|nr:MAG: hypothetical protein A2V95_01585 [Candidatus Kuenenbacteria bacterium RBG_16_41_7]
MTSLFFILLSLIALYLKITPITEAIPLRYTVYFGIDLIAPWWSVFLFLLSGLAIFIFNFVLAYLLFLKSNILAYFLMLSATLIQLVLVIVSFLIILLNN